MDRGSLGGYSLYGCKESERTEAIEYTRTHPNTLYYTYNALNIHNRTSNKYGLEIKNFLCITHVILNRMFWMCLPNGFLNRCFSVRLLIHRALEKKTEQLKSNPEVCVQSTHGCFGDFRLSTMVDIGQQSTAILFKTHA